MDLIVEPVNVWAASIKDEPGGLAQVLSGLREAGADLDFILARRAAETPGPAVVFVTPLRGDREVAAAADLGFNVVSTVHSVRIEGENKPGEFNSEIPSGYTYLAQIVSHDVVYSVAQGPDVTDTSPPIHNLRTDRLILDTLYGRGPGAAPAPYAPNRKAAQHRTRLRLGKTRLNGRRPAGGPELDIPRVGCPEIDNRAGLGATEALLADPRRLPRAG